jgi:hypothetical protein
MIPILINGNPYTLPTKWSEITVRQYRDLNRHKDEIEKADNFANARLISIFTGINFDTLLNFDCSSFTNEVLPALTFVEKDIDLFAVKRADKIKIGSKEVNAIVDPKRERLGQKLYLEQVLEKAIENKTHISEIVAPVVACYYAPKLNDENKWILENVEAVQELVLESTVVTMIPETVFFLIGYINNKKSKTRQSA